jgi:hypothetical protein
MAKDDDGDKDLRCLIEGVFTLNSRNHSGVRILRDGYVAVAIGRRTAVEPDLWSGKGGRLMNINFAFGLYELSGRLLYFSRSLLASGRGDARSTWRIEHAEEAEVREIELIGDQPTGVAWTWIRMPEAVSSHAPSARGR